MTKYPEPIMPYVEAWHAGGKHKPTSIILRPSFTHSRDGAALAVAQTMHKHHNPSLGISHYVVDNIKRFRCVRDNEIAGCKEAFCGTNKGAIRITMCAEPISGEIFWDWNLHQEVIHRTAKLVAELTLIHKIKPRILDEEQRQRWSKRSRRRRGGIIIEEPSGWPSADFLKVVETERLLLERKYK